MIAAAMGRVGGGKVIRWRDWTWQLRVKEVGVTSWFLDWESVRGVH